MCDEVVIVENSGSLYLGGPPLVKAATGEDLTSEELGGARVHCTISGCTDHFATSEEEAFVIARGIVSSLNLPPQMTVNRVLAQPPAHESSDEVFASLIPKTMEEEWPMLEVRGLLIVAPVTGIVAAVNCSFS
jgi:3-methylcrotonyl-CoA carboxylase beta subunit